MHSSGKSVRPLWLHSGKVHSCGYSSEGVVVRPLGLLLNRTSGMYLWFVVYTSKCLLYKVYLLWQCHCNM